MVLKKKEIIAASLVLLIGMAGYLNWSYQDTIHVTDGESYIETGKRLGEAQYVSSTEKDVEENSEETPAPEEQSEETSSVDVRSIDQIKTDKEAARSKSLEILKETAANESFDEQTRQKAGDKIIETAKNVEGENTFQSVALSKGYEEVCVLCEDGAATIMVKKDGFGDDDVVKLTEIGTSSLGISANNIKIVEVR